MDYEELIDKLKAAKIRSSKVIDVEKTGDRRCVALHIGCSPLLKDDKEKRIQEVCGSDYSISWLGNDNNYFLITAKSSP